MKQFKTVVLVFILCHLLEVYTARLREKTDVPSKLDAEAKNDRSSNQAHDWEYPIQHPEGPGNNLPHPNEYSPISPNTEYNVPVINQPNPVSTFQYPNQYNPTAPSIPDTNQYKPDSSQHNPVPKFQYPNEYNPIHPTPNVPKIDPNIWDRIRKHPNSIRSRPYRRYKPYRRYTPYGRYKPYRSPFRLRRPRPCKPSFWGYYWRYYYGSYSKY